MSQLTNPYSFTATDSVTAAKLNNLISQTTIGPETISTQNEKTTPVSTDVLLGLDGTTSQLIKIKTGNLSLSGLTTTSIIATAGSDILITPQDGTIVTGCSFTSALGLITVVTTSVAHGLTVGQVVTTSAATQTGYNGTHRITAVTTVAPFTFTYVMTTAGTIGSGTISYIKQGVVKNPEHEVINGNLYVDGNAVITGTTTQVGNVAVTGNSTVTGTTLQKGNLNSVGSINNVTLDATTGAILKTFKVNPSFHYFVQHRQTAIYSLTWGGAQNMTNEFGTEIGPVSSVHLRLQFTPKKAGNKIILQWNITCEPNDGANTVYVVTRTVVSTGVESPIKDLSGNNLSVNSNNDTWSGTAVTGYDPESTSTPLTNTIKIVDENSLDVECIYRLRARLSRNATYGFNLNRTINSFGSVDNESGMSMGHAHEICEI